MRKSIKTAVWLRIAVIFIALVLSTSFTISGLNTVETRTQSTKRANEINTLALNAGKAHLSWGENLSASIAFQSEFTGNTDYTSCILGDWLYNTDMSMIPDQRIVSLMQEMEPIHKRIHESAIEIIEKKSTDLDAAKDIYLNQTKVDINTLLGMLEEVISISTGLVAQDEAMLSSSLRTTKIVFCCSIVLIVIVSIMLIQYILRKIVAPIGIITESSKKLAQGDLGFQIDLKSDNEIGVLAGSLNSSVHTLGTYVEDISEALSQIAGGDLTRENGLQYIGDFVKIQSSIEMILSQLNTTMSKIAVASEQVSHGAEQVSSGAQSLAQGATEQTIEIEKLVEQVSDVSSRIGNSAHNAADTSLAAANVGEQIEICNQKMQDMAEAMKEISSSSQEIGNIIKAIEDIAFQTNILALNAAVEAARAGTAGKGFAVVADEVRNLAAKSAEAAQSTTTLIEKSLRAVSHGVELTASARDSLNAVVDGARVVTDSVHEISEVSASQSESVESINSGISQISLVVQTNSATSEESAAASEELFSQAQMLKSLVGQFKMKESHLRQEQITV